MQAASGIYLGWARDGEEGRFLYRRQLRDMKGSAVVETMNPAILGFSLAPGATTTGAVASALASRKMLRQRTAPDLSRWLQPLPLQQRRPHQGPWRC
jgi:hypothetical protein